MYHFFHGNEVRPAGWLLQQLTIQAKGLSGNLDLIWPDVQDSAWIGGSRDSWERVPYWLDGFIPLACLLEDEDLKLRADRYIHAILDRQAADGWICPCTLEERKTYDLWAFFLIGKVLALYCEFTDDARARDGLYRAMKCLHKMLKNEETRLTCWAQFRWFECLIPLHFLWEQYREDWIRELARCLRAQGADYCSYTEQWKRPMNQWTHQTHIVNLCMMLKSEALCCELLEEPYENQAEKLWKILEEYNGTAVGTFTGDECLSGIANNQGTELCGVVELMFTCELLYSITRDPIWAERLERIAFNALPAALSDDMWTHQYDQMVNQIACIRFPGKSFFRTNESDAHLFGLEPNFGCCTANFNQGWPKLALSTFIRTDHGILCSMLPSRLKTKINHVEVIISIDSAYPFRLSCNCTVQAAAPVHFALTFRIPEWAKDFQVNGRSVASSGSHPFHTIEKEWGQTETLSIACTDVPHLKEQASGLTVAEYGPLVFSLPIQAEYKRLEYVRDGVKRCFPYCDYELYPQSEWRYGFASDALTVCECEGHAVPFSSEAPSIQLKARLRPVKWDYADGYDSVSARMPACSDGSEYAGASDTDPVVERNLYPYGCAKLRMTEMPGPLK